MALTKAEVKILISLNNKRSRLKSSRFLVDGVRLLEEALAARYYPVILYYSPSDLNERGHALVRGFIDKKVQAQTISAKECAKISGTKASQGIIALFDVKKYNLQQQLKSRPRRILICDGIADPGNLGTLIRSATAFDFSLIIAIEHSAEITNPKTVRASMGAFFKVPIVSGVDGAELVTALTEAGYHLYLADIAGVHIDRTDSPADLSGLVVGSEATGASGAFAVKGITRLRIPMSDKAESLNAAVAGSLLMHWFRSAERKKA